LLHGIIEIGSAYDGNLKRIDNRQTKEERQSEGQSTSMKQDTKRQRQSSDDDGPAAPQEAKKRKKKQSNSM
jgi:hypothetical protein